MRGRDPRIHLAKNDGWPVKPGHDEEESQAPVSRRA
jgi:hypothetical protein